MRIVIDTDEIKAKAKRLLALIREGYWNVRERWREEAILDGQRSIRAQQEALLKRAGMDEFQLNTGVVRATAQDGRIGITSSFDRDFGDCVCIQWRQENDPPAQWRVAHYSPAKARLIALLLIERAEAIEKREGAFDIDTAPGTANCLAARAAAAA